MPLLIAALFVLFPLAWILDLPPFVRDSEGVFERVAQWLSATFHVAMSVILVMTGSEHIGLIWAAFASLVLAMRVAAGATPATKLSPGRWFRTLSAFAPMRYGVPAALALSWLTRESSGGFFSGSAYLGAIALTFWLLRTGAKFGKEEAAAHARDVATHNSLRLGIASISGVPVSVLDEQTRIRPRNDGSVVIEPVPAALAKKVHPGNLTALDVGFSHVLPHLEIDPDSDHECIVLRPVTDETRRRRATLVATRGIITGSQSVNPAPATGAPVNSGGLGNLDLRGE